MIAAVLCMVLFEPRFYIEHSQAKFHFDTRGHRTLAHTDKTSTPLEGPWPPLQQPYSISRRAGPLNA
jgi:hypothetical protein